MNHQRSEVLTDYILVEVSLGENLCRPLRYVNFIFFFLSYIFKIKKKKTREYVSGDVPIGRRHSRCYTFFSFFFNFGTEAEHGKLRGILFK